jgi:hypothetical protein
LRTALKHNKNIIVIWDKDHCPEFPKEDDVPDDLLEILSIRFIIWSPVCYFRNTVTDQIIKSMKIELNNTHNNSHIDLGHKLKEAAIAIKAGNTNYIFDLNDKRYIVTLIGDADGMTKSWATTTFQCSVEYIEACHNVNNRIRLQGLDLNVNVN